MRLSKASNVTGDQHSSIVDEALLAELTTLVSAAAAAILAARAVSLDPRAKADLSPVTAADHAAEAVLIEGLARVLPGVSIISEEMTALPERLSDTFILVDPLDGTRELLAGRTEFTVNVAIVSGGAPCFGIVAAPAQGMVWRGIPGRGADRLHLPAGAKSSTADARFAIQTRRCPSSGLVAAVSRSHPDSATEALLARLPIARRRLGGSAVKFCHLAEGGADIYPRLSTTCEWDVAAGHAILVAAGGTVTAPKGAPLVYGQVAARFRVPAFIAWGDPTGATRFGLVEASKDTGQAH
jgi:3'(2'), 5'-bisphosphate nucleotidase